MTDTTHALVLREENGNRRLTFATATPRYRADTGVCLQITNGTESFPIEELDRDEVAELYQFLSEILDRFTGQVRAVKVPT